MCARAWLTLASDLDLVDLAQHASAIDWQPQQYCFRDAIKWDMMGSVAAVDQGRLKDVTKDAAERIRTGTIRIQL